MKQWFHRAVLARTWVAFLVMGLSFFAFGVGTLNLFMLLKANADLLRDYGWQAVMDGGVRQLLELLASGYASLACYLVFKACETRLTQALVSRR